MRPNDRVQGRGRAATPLARVPCNPRLGVSICSLPICCSIETAFIADSEHIARAYVAWANWRPDSARVLVDEEALDGVSEETELPLDDPRLRRLGDARIRAAADVRKEVRAGYLVCLLPAYAIRDIH